MEVKHITLTQTYPLRHKVLRPGRPLETCFFPEDSQVGSFHLGAILNDDIVGIASFYFEDSPRFKETHQLRLRGMATALEVRGKGAGAELMKFATEMVIKGQHSLLWCNARIEACGFYHRCGFDAFSDVFEIPPIGAHKVMYFKP